MVNQTKKTVFKLLATREDKDDLSFEVETKRDVLMLAKMLLKNNWQVSTTEDTQKILNLV